MVPLLLTTVLFPAADTPLPAETSAEARLRHECKSRNAARVRT